MAANLERRDKEYIAANNERTAKGEARSGARNGTRRQKWNQGPEVN